MELTEIEECGHEFEFVDESFDHEFGTEVVQFMQCQKCGFVRDCDPDDFYDPREFDDDK